MPLSRLENFLKNIQGNVIYVNPEELDATDDVSNTGNSRTRPFKTIQRALIESARFSYQLGKDNDKFDKTTIILSPGVHYVDNRPGYKIDTAGTVNDINGSSQTINQLSVGTEFDLQNAGNVLYQFNSIHGGVILPRGTSIVGQDLRKTKVRPKFVPDPNDTTVASSAIFRVTGGTYVREVSIFDGDPADRVYKDYTNNVYQPNFSHHKLTCFEFADGVNTVTGQGITDLDMYYAKLTLAYGNSSGRALPTYPTNDDFEPVVDEARIVGEISQLGSLEIEDIYSGINPSDPTATTIVSVVTSEPHGFNVETPINVKGVAGNSNVNGTEYDGVHVVSQVLSDTLFTYSVNTAPAATATPNLAGLSPIVTVESDTVTSSSPYIFNCSLRSVFGMNGLYADGSKATGFKSMVAAQFTGISLNKDDTAFVKYNNTSGTYQDQASLGTSAVLHTDSRARHKPTYESFHIKASNDAALQLVSTFAVGCGKQFICESGADASITNSNSNFGSVGFGADGSKSDAFSKDDKGFISGIVPAQKNYAKIINYNWLKLDVELTIAAPSTKLYLRGYNNKDTIPPAQSSIYTVGNKVGEDLGLTVAGITSTANVLMTVPSGSGVSGKKEHHVGRAAGINSITTNTITLQGSHNLFQGESIQFFSDTGSLPDGLDYGKTYYAITQSPLASDQIKIATSISNALANNAITGINNLGGGLRIVSDVAMKQPGDPGHPVQFDGTGWYVNVDSGNLLHTLITQNQSTITPETSNTFIKRKPDNRKDLQKIYRLRYVLPDGATNASQPQNGYSIADSGTVIDDDKFQNDNTPLTGDLDLRSDTNIIHASWASNVGIITTKFPHRLRRGQVIQINRLRSENNANGVSNLGYNGMHEILSIDDKKTFRIGINTNPGGISTITPSVPYTFHNLNIVGSGRTFSPYFVRKDYGNSYQIFNQEQVQEHQEGRQDGVYDLTLVGYTNIPEIAPFDIGSNRFAQNINNLKPNVSPDNPEDDPLPAVSYAVRDDIGQVETNDPARSISKEATLEFIQDIGVGIALTESNFSGSDVTLFTESDHGFNSIIELSGITGGSQYGRNSGSAEFYFSVDLVGGTGKGATADVTVAASSTITAMDMVDFGSGYSIGDVLTVRGVPFHTPGADCQVTVSEIDNNLGDIVQVVGIGSTGYNGLRKITNITDPKKIMYEGDVGAASTGGYFYHVGVSTGITNILHDTISGIATVYLDGDLGLRRGDIIQINNSNTVYNGQHPVQERVGYGASLSVLINAGSSPTFQEVGGAAYAHGTGINYRAFGKTVPIYGGQTTTITSGISTTSTSISLTKKNKFRRGDYIQIEDEICRITNQACNEVSRGALGSNATNHVQNTCVQKIKVLPIESRRHSTIRASGHTFEYVGFGPGNYSTAMPQTQDRVLNDKQQLLAQSTATRGGSVVYSGMNDRGEFFIGRKKIDALTGEEISTIQNFDSTPILNIPSTIDFDDLTVNDNLYSNGNTEIIDLRLRGNRSGDVGASVYVGINGSAQAAPVSTIDNIIFNQTFDAAGFIGWIRTSDSSQPWKKWGPISVDHTEHYAIDKLALNKNKVDHHWVLETNGDAKIVGSSHVTGIGTFGQGVVASTAKVGDLTTGRVVTAGTGGELQDSSSLTFSGATLTANTLVVTTGATVTQTLTAEQITSTDDMTASGTVTAANFIGNGVIPIGGIIMWSGTDSNVPSNWALCNGSNGTPNLIDKFIVGRGSAYAAGATGGFTDSVVVQHDHTATSSVTDPGHAHTFSSHNDDTADGNTLNDRSNLPNTRTMTSSSNTTGISVSTSVDQEGVSGAGKNLPPYYAIAYIMRVS